MQLRVVLSGDANVIAYRENAIRFQSALNVLQDFYDGVFAAVGDRARTRSSFNGIDWFD